MLFAVAIVSTRRTEPKVIHAYTRTHTPCIYMQRVAVYVALASCRVLRASYLPLAKGNKLNPVEAVDARGCAVGGSTTYAAITITTITTSTIATITTIATNKAPAQQHHQHQHQHRHLARIAGVCLRCRVC